MPLPDPKPLTVERVTGNVPAVANAATNTVALVAPFQGRVIKVGVTVGSAIATGDATCTTDINTTAITGGVITCTSAASARGSTFSATPTGANMVNESDGIGFVFTGGGTGGGVATVWADIRRGS